jgi:ABC-type multidrug transport system permease subunit
MFLNMHEAFMKMSIVALLLAALVTITLSGCFPNGGSYSAQEPAGFFSGVWHGWIAPISLIAGLFKNDIRVYEPFNTGWWYDFGFYIAVIAGFGGIALFRKGKKRDRSS